MTMDDASWRRWRLILGREPFLEQDKNALLSSEDLQRDVALDYLYSREYDKRGGKNGGSERSSLKPAEWLAGVRKVFPKSTCEILQKHAIDRYQLTQLLTDPDVLSRAKPNMDLVEMLLSFRNHLPPEVMGIVRGIIHKVCSELEAVLSKKILASFASHRLRHKHGGYRQLSNLDWASSIRRNLKNYHADSEQLILERLYFYQRQNNQVPWDIFLVVDQSGSMISSIVHSAVLASIFCRLKSLRTHLILFDTQVVDLTDHVGDPVDNLLSVQLGGGTDIAGALQYTSTKITQSQRSVVILISDFYEGGDPRHLLQIVAALKENHTKMLGLAALDGNAKPDYDEQLARRLLDVGMPVAAMTPEHLASWVASVI